MKKLSSVAAATAVTVTVLFTAGCADDPERYSPAPNSTVVNKTPIDTIQMGEGSDNVSTKCDHGNRIYVTLPSDDNYTAIDVVPQDPTCKEAGQ